MSARHSKKYSVVCDYCRSNAELVGGDVIYPRRPDLHSKHFYLCRPCHAYVGCHPGTANPLGRLADAELRRAKSAAHAAFDPMWEAKIRRDGCSKSEARTRGYAWLAKELGIAIDDCHIGMMDVAMCRLVVDVCLKARKLR